MHFLTFILRELRKRVIPLVMVGFTMVVGVALYLNVRLSAAALMLVFADGILIAMFSYSVSQRRRLESMVRLESERTALIDLATHQLGMPLATFRWWLEILRDRQQGAGAEDCDALEQLQLGVDRMDHIVRSLHEAASLQAGSTSYHGEAVDPIAFVQQVVKFMGPAFDLKHQRVSVVAPESLPRIVIDQKLMTDVVGELLENARGYSPSGTELTVRLSVAGAMVAIEIEDHGVGISAEDLPNIFGKFARGKNAHLSKPVGNGLGLYICKGIVERGKGKLSIKSVEKVGTTVRLELPIAK